MSAASLFRRLPLVRPHLVAVYPDGFEYTLQHRDGFWWYRPMKAAKPLSLAKARVEELGGCIERRQSRSQRNGF